MPEAKRRGRSPADPEFGPMSNAEKVCWYRKRQARLHRDMALLLLDLWERQPAEWREAHEYQQREVLDLAHRLAAQPED
jgi:hypothetical protein